MHYVLRLSLIIFVTIVPQLGKCLKFDLIQGEAAGEGGSDRSDDLNLNKEI